MHFEGKIFDIEIMTVEPTSSDAPALESQEGVVAKDPLATGVTESSPGSGSAELESEVQNTSSFQTSSLIEKDEIEHEITSTTIAEEISEEAIVDLGDQAVENENGNENETPPETFAIQQEADESEEPVESSQPIDDDDDDDDDDEDDDEEFEETDLHQPPQGGGDEDESDDSTIFSPCQF